MVSESVAADALPDFEHRRKLRRAVIASTIGTTIEWYDFLLYSIASGLVFAKLYFPGSDPLTGTLQAYAVFLSASWLDRLAHLFLVTLASGSAARAR
jgi:hypothetical protein